MLSHTTSHPSSLCRTITRSTSAWVSSRDRRWRRVSSPVPLKAMLVPRVVTPIGVSALGVVPLGFFNHLTPRLSSSSSFLSGYLEGQGTANIINRSVALAYWQAHERGLQDLEQGRGNFRETWHKHGPGLLGVVVDTSHCAGRGFHKYRED